MIRSIGSFVFVSAVGTIVTIKTSNLFSQTDLHLTVAEHAKKAAGPIGQHFHLDLGFQKAQFF
ncbi:MAG: hypothetical protein IPH59_12205 [bacterium]|nr:hypothetical protein [bacterium]